MGTDVTVQFRAEDPPPLLVTDRSPGTSQTMVPRDATIDVYFSEGVKRSSVVLGSSFIVRDMDTLADIPGVISWNDPVDLDPTDPDMTGDDDHLTFTPNNLLGYSQRVEVIMAPSGADIESDRATSRGGQVKSPGPVWNFRVQDPPQLTVVSASPSNGAVGVATDAQISFSFSEGVDQSTLDVNGDGTIDAADAAGIEISDITAGTSITGAIAWNAPDPPAGADLIGTDTTFTITPSAPFVYSHRIRVTLKAAISSDRATSFGGTLGSDYSYTFTVTDLPPLTVLATSPSGGGINIDVTQNIQIVFDRDFDMGTVTANPGASGEISNSAYINPGLASDFANALPATYTEPVAGKLVIDPDSSLEFDTDYTVTLTTAICEPKDPASAGGCLTKDVNFSFHTSPVPKLRVTATDPGDGAVNISLSPTIKVTFNNDINSFTLNNEPGGGGDGNLPNIFINPGQTTNFTGAIPTTMIGYDAATRTASFQPSAPLAKNTVYTVTVTMDVQDIFGGTLTSPYSFTFRTRLSALIASISPSDGNTDVSIYTAVRVTFTEAMDKDTINNGTFYLLFKDRFGQLTPVPATISFESGDTVAVLTPNWAISNCAESTRPLEYNQTYVLHLEPSIATNSGQRLGDIPPVTLKTGLPPGISAIRSEGSIIELSIDDRNPLDNATETPVNSTFIVEFDKDMEVGGGAHAIDNPANFELWNTMNTIDTSDDVQVNLSVTTRGNRTAVVYLSNVLANDTDYRFIVQGRDSSDNQEIHDSAGRFLEGNTEVKFRTSPGFTASLSPPHGENTRSTAMTPVVFTRPLYFPSINDEAIYAVDNTQGRRLTGILALSTADRSSVAYIPVPAYIPNNDVTVFVTTGVKDFLGNPLPAGKSVNYPDINSAPATNARVPDSVVSVTPGSGSVAGDATITINFQTGSNLRDRMLPVSINSSTVYLTDVNGCHGPAGGHLQWKKKFNIGPAFGTDSVDIQSTVFFRNGCNYDLTIVQSQFANIYTIGNTLGDVTRTYTGEGVAPTTAANQVTGDRLAGQDLALDGASDVVTTTDIRVTFSERMDLSSADTATFVLYPTGGDPVTEFIPGAYREEGNAIIFDPGVTLKGGQSYDVLLTSGLTDTAGNGLAGTPMTITFTAETERPSLVAITPADGTPNVSVDTTIEADFSEPMDPATIFSGMFNPPAIGSWIVGYLDQCTNTRLTYGCVRLSGDRTKAFFDPVEPWQLVGETQYGMDLDETIVADLGGNLLDKSIGVGTPIAFQTASGQPVVSCTSPAQGDVGVPIGTVVDVYFNEPVDKGSFENAFLMFRVSDGLDIGGNVTAPNGDPGILMRFTPDSSLDNGTEYGFIVNTNVQDSDGNPLLTEYRARFTTP
ncbi:MAG: Ig-like domain-containing protein [Deltaproteobacteria bacterium]|nr:Ig-like domain-containing protein [Deltaproteobacteria bacterium]